MDFGRLSDIEGFDFSFPPEPEENAAVLHTLGGKHEMICFAGAPQWTDPDWPGLIYPKQMRASETLRHYARQFNAVELNTTFYRIPAPQTVESWSKSASPGFHFCPKIPQLISHERMLVNCQDVSHVFADVMRGLGESLGMFFLQLPQNFGVNQLEDLKKWILLFPRDLALAVEFRHHSWFADKKTTDHVFDFLSEQNVSAVITDTAGRRDVLHMRLTNARTFIRFAANNGHRSDAPRIKAWAEKIAAWKMNGLEEAYFFMHSPQHTKIPELNNLFVQEMNRAGGTQLSPCRFIQDEQPELF